MALEVFANPGYLMHKQTKDCLLHHDCPTCRHHSSNTKSGNFEDNYTERCETCADDSGYCCWQSTDPGSNDWEALTECQVAALKRLHN